MTYKFVFKSDFENGWGDTFIGIYDLVNLVDHIRTEHPNSEFTLLINNRHNSNGLNVALDVEFFEKHFNTFKILSSEDLVTLKDGMINYLGIDYRRLYSGNNYDPSNSSPGCLDVFILEEQFVSIKNLNISYESFKFNFSSKNVKDFSVYNKEIMESIERFISDNFKGEFESIYYRSSATPQINKMEAFILELVNTLDKDKEYFFCSNSALVKQMIMKTDLNIKLFRGMDNHEINHIPNGFVHHGNQKDVDTFFAVGEMVILGKSNVIHYDGEQSYPSLFNWYANVVKNVKLIDYAK
jgi:hypothetical protein